MHVRLSFIDYTILAIYFAFVIGVGWALKRYIVDSKEFFVSGRSILAIFSSGISMQAPAAGVDRDTGPCCDVGRQRDFLVISLRDKQ